MPRPCLAVIGLVLLLATACKKEHPVPSGDVASALALPTLDGDTFDPATLRGKPTIVTFWRPGCQYCAKEMPAVAKVARDRGAAAVAVLVAGSRDAARRYAADFDGTILVDDGTLRTRYEVSSVPYTLILRGDGTAARAFLGMQGEATLSSALSGVR